MKTILVLGALAALVACVPPSTVALQQGAVAETSQFEPVITINGKEDTLPARPGAAIWERYMNRYNIYSLRSWIDKATGKATHQLYVSVGYSGEWRFYVNASGQDAQALPFTDIKRDVTTCAGGSCSYREIFGVELSETLLAANPNGYSVKVYAKDGSSIIVPLTGAQIAEQVRAVTEARATLKLKTVKTPDLPWHLPTPTLPPVK